jgi:hypothetical protein
MSSTDYLAGIRVKIERAKKHIRDLEVKIRSFLGNDLKPYIITREREPDTGDLVFNVASVRDVPLEFSAILGDAIHNLRGVLDYLAYALVVREQGHAPGREVGFPVYCNAKRYEARKLRKIGAMGEAAIKAIDALKPYKGGNNALWRLSKLNNIDKHRLLIVAVIARQDFKKGPKSRRIFEFRRSPVKVGDELLRIPPHFKNEVYMEPFFEVAFAESEVIECEPVIPTLNMFTEAVENALARLSVFL